MDIAQMMLGNMVGILALCLVLVAVAKIFQTASTLNDVKSLLEEMKRNHTLSAQLPGVYRQSGEAMLQALSEAQEPAVRPEIIPR